MLHRGFGAQDFLCCDEHLWPLSTEAGLLRALNARVLPPLEPLATWTRPGKIELPDGVPRRQRWWSTCLIQVQAAVLEASLDLKPRGEGMPAAGCRHHPSQEQSCASRARNTPLSSSGIPGPAPTAQGGHDLSVGNQWTSLETTRSHVASRASE